MNERIKKSIENGELEVLLVQKNLASRIKNLSKSLDTIPADVLDAALKLMEKGMGREIIVRGDKWDLKINALKNQKPQTALTKNG